MSGPSGAPDRIWGTVQDVTDRMRAEQQIRYLSYFDSLTALPNRRMLMEHLGRVLGHANRCGEAVAVLCLDLDRFNRINDTFGHTTGDECLKAVAEQLMECVRSTDYVGRSGPDGPVVSRLGGDEFMVVLRDVAGPEGASVAARRLLDVLKRPFAVPGGEIVLSGTIGIALHPFDGSNGETLVANAEAAMYAAKRENRDSYQFFNDSMNRRALRELLLERSLEGAAERRELAVHYQPVIDTETGRLTGVEALLRWSSREFGMVPPAEFIPLAEETGRIVTLGEWVLRTACHQLRAWRAAGLSHLRLAVNVSNHQLRRPEFAGIIEATLRECGMEASSLELEITESALIRDEPMVVESLGRLRRMGVRIALDDFGTGYSSLSHLVRFPIDIIKIDRSFVQRCGAGEQGRAIIAAVIAMARHLRLQVTAEGVETGAQEAFLREQGCHMLQGFRFARPLEPKALLAWQRGERGSGASDGG